MRGAVLSAFAGAYLGKRMLEKTKIEKLYQFVAFALMIFGILLALGIIAKN